MASRSQKLVALLGITALLLGAACSGDEEEPAPPEEVAETPLPDPICALSGAEGTDAQLDRPAVAVKIENSPAAYPLSGLDDAEVVFEELVEGGLTRFMAIYHCTDSKKAGPVRSARVVDPPIMSPITRILAAAGGNKPVRKALDKANIITIDEDTPGNSLRRISRPGISSEHTLYANTELVRKVGQKKYEEAPGVGLFKFGDLPSGGNKAKSVTLFFSQSRPIEYRWSGDAWKRSEAGQPFTVEGGEQIAVDNLIVEFHKVNYSKTIVDVAGNPSIEIVDPIGQGSALVFRDGRVFEATWSRKAITDRVVYEFEGEEIALAEGTTWVALLPNAKGEVKGSFEVKPALKKKGSKKS